MKQEDLHDWRKPVDLSLKSKTISSFAEKREKQKRRYKTSRQWSKQATNLTGLKGEFAFFLCTGIPVDTGLHLRGDWGTDFIYEGISYDIKSTISKSPDPALLEMPDKKLSSHVYVLIRVNEWEAKILGWATRKQMRHSQKRNFGKGERLSIHESELKSMGQTGIPPCVPSASTDPQTAKDRSKKQLNETDTIIKLLESEFKIKNDRRIHCFPHGPFEERSGVATNRMALYCTKCGRFYGYPRNKT